MPAIPPLPAQTAWRSGGAFDDDVPVQKRNVSDAVQPGDLFYKREKVKPKAAAPPQHQTISNYIMAACLAKKTVRLRIQSALQLVTALPQSYYFFR